jgi:hypothetical protein
MQTTGRLAGDTIARQVESKGSFEPVEKIDEVKVYFSHLIEHRGSNFHKSKFFHPIERGTLAYFLILYLEASVGRL